MPLTAKIPRIDHSEGLNPIRLSSRFYLYPCPLNPPPCSHIMATEQYHEPPNELPEETRTFARMMQSLIEEAEAINWYEQRLAVEKDKVARSIMSNAQHEEFKHFGMDLEFLLRKKPVWRELLKGVLFTKGDIVKSGDEAEENTE